MQCCRPQSLKKRVRWKRQRHHRVYEYPPEPRSWEQHAFTEPQYRRSWGSSSSVDYLNLAGETLKRLLLLGDLFFFFIQLLSVFIFAFFFPFFIHSIFPSIIHTFAGETLERLLYLGDIIF